jgi:hypothetical protein
VFQCQFLHSTKKLLFFFFYVSFFFFLIACKKKKVCCFPRRGVLFYSVATKSLYRLLRLTQLKL